MPGQASLSGHLFGKAGAVPMLYPRMRQARFLSRPNRFVAWVELDGQEVLCHVKNTGRCRELLLPGAEVWIQQAEEGAVRKTAYDLIAVRKGARLINMDAQAPNHAAEEWIRSGGLFRAWNEPERRLDLLKPECRYGNSRFDFYLETQGRRAFLEVKGVTLEEDGIVLFPDAPTQRGVKHLEELCACLEEGYHACLLLVVQMEDVRCFRPNDRTHPEFGKALRRAASLGVEVLAYDCRITEQSMEIRRPVPVEL